MWLLSKQKFYFGGAGVSFWATERCSGALLPALVLGKSCSARDQKQAFCNANMYIKPAFIFLEILISITILNCFTNSIRSCNYKIQVKLDQSLNKGPLKVQNRGRSQKLNKSINHQWLLQSLWEAKIHVLISDKQNFLNSKIKNRPGM